MKRLVLLLALVALGLAVSPESGFAQKQRPAARAGGPDQDGDGVPDATDRCSNTPRSTKVTSDGCPVRLLSLVQSQDARQATPAGAPARAGQGAVAPQAVQGAAEAAGQPAAAGAGTFTAGLAMPGLRPGPSALDQFIRRFAQGLDSTIVSLRSVFLNTMGQPWPGAENPGSLPQREQERWARCRALHWDLTTYAPALETIADSLPQTAAVQRAVTALDSALNSLDATAECDNVASMIAAPDRWTPWGQQYAATAREFHDNWYPQIRDLHEKHRAFVIALNGTLPAARRLPVPPGLPRTPPYAGAGP